MSGHFELGEIIKNHRDTDIGKYLGSGVNSSGWVGDLEC